MARLSERVAYITGLADGLQLDGSTKEGKVLIAMLSVLEDIAAEVEMQDEAVTDLIESVDSINEDLADLEEFVYEEFDEDDDDEDDDFDDDFEADDDEADEDEFVELECPDCGETVYFSADMLERDESPVCPNCGSIIEASTEE